MRKYFTFLLVCVATLFGLHNSPGAVFLMIWPAARPTALGGSFTAIADDPSATYYNPAGLAFQKKFNATLMHCNWLPGLWPGMYYEFLALTYGTEDKGTFGFNTIYLSTGETPVTNEKGDPLGEYVTFDIATGLSYAYPVLSNLGIGLSWKFIYSFLVPNWVWEAMPELGIERGGTGITWAFDGGILYKPFRWLSLGSSISNLGRNISYVAGGESDPLPRMLRIATNFIPLENEHLKLQISPEINFGLVAKAQKFSEEWRDAWKSLGIEFSYANIFHGRIGYFEDVVGWRGGLIVEKDDTEECISILEYLFNRKGRKLKQGARSIAIPFTYGFGITVRNFCFDIGIDNLIYSFETQNIKFSFTYRM